MANQLLPLERKFISLAAELAESLSLSSTLARIYALLFIRKDPLSLEEIASLLGMSKGHASVNLRVLEAWGAVNNAWVPGTRKDHYLANLDIKAIVLRRLEEGLSRRLSWISEKMGTFHDELSQRNGDSSKQDNSYLLEQLKVLQSHMNTAEKLLKWAPQLKQLGKLPF